jgi:hypothetical protein
MDIAQPEARAARAARVTPEGSEERMGETVTIARTR